MLNTRLIVTVSRCFSRTIWVDVFRVQSELWYHVMHVLRYDTIYAGLTVDQIIACVLMLVALALTYLIH